MVGVEADFARLEEGLGEEVLSIQESLVLLFIEIFVFIFAHPSSVILLKFSWFELLSSKDSTVSRHQILMNSF